MPLVVVRKITSCSLTHHKNNQQQSTQNQANHQIQNSIKNYRPHGHDARSRPPAKGLSGFDHGRRG